MGAVLFGCALVVADALHPTPTDPYASTIEIPDGSGVVVADGYVLTAAHIARGWQEEGYDAGFVTFHPELDVAVIEWPTDGKTAALLARYWTKRGQEVSLVGIVQRRSEIHTRGHTGFLRERPGMSVHSCPAGPGTSGSPLFDTSGRVVGIHTGSYIYPLRGVAQISTAEFTFVEMAAIVGWIESVVGL